MQLDVPEGTTVQIFIGAVPLAPIQGPSRAEPDQVLVQAPEPRRRRPLLRGSAITGLALAAFLAGQHAAPRRDVLAMASNASAPPADAAPTPAPAHHYEQAFPLRPLNPEPTSPPAPAGALPDQLPQAFAQQLQQRPTITPSPGSPPPSAGTPAAKPFGLED